MKGKKKLNTQNFNLLPPVPAFSRQPNTGQPHSSTNQTRNNLWNRIVPTGLLLLRRRPAPLENLELNKAERHQAESEPRHDSSEEHEKARHSGVNKPPERSEFNVLRPEHELAGGRHRT